MSLLRRILTDSITESHVVVHELSWQYLSSTEKSVICYSLFFWSLNSTMRFKRWTKVTIVTSILSKMLCFKNYLPCESSRRNGIHQFSSSNVDHSFHQSWRNARRQSQNGRCPPEVMRLRRISCLQNSRKGCWNLLKFVSSFHVQGWLANTNTNFKSSL